MMELNDTPAGKLEWLAKLLEQGEQIPDELAKSCAALIREALENNGKLAVGPGRGHPKKTLEIANRAVQVAVLRARNPELTVKQAAKQVAAKLHRVKQSTVEDNYKDHGKFARSYAKFITEGATRAEAEELKSLLGTFRYDDGSYLTTSDVDDLCEKIAYSDVRSLLHRIYNAPTPRRDMKLLKEILS